MAGLSSAVMMFEVKRFLLRLSFSKLFLAFLFAIAGYNFPAMAQSADVKTQELGSSGNSALPELPAPASADTSLPAAILGDDYILGVGDRLQIDVFNIPDYSGEFQILSGGSLSVPVVGSIPIAGLSLRQASEVITQSLRPYVREPYVTVSVLSPRPMQIAIAGEVHRPGAYQIEANEFPTLTQAIELADGITQLANIREIEVKRRLPVQISTATTSLIDRDKQAPFQSISVNLWDLLKEGDLSEDIQLQDGDRIVIPTANVLSSDEVIELSTASFSPEDISVNVVGEVGKPGTISVPSNSPLNQAILAAGGFSNRARKGTVSLVRLNPNGTASQRKIEVDLSEGVNEDINPSLRPNDTVIVEASGLARTGDLFRTIVSPLNFGLNLFRLFGL